MVGLHQVHFQNMVELQKDVYLHLQKDVQLELQKTVMLLMQQLPTVLRK